MNKIILAIHGIRSNGNRIKKLFTYIKKNSRYNNEILIAYNYGFLLAINCINPFVKFGAVKKLMKRLRKIQNKYPNSEIDVVAHSYGSELIHRAVKHSGEDGKSNIKINKLILFGSILPVYEDFNETVKISKIKEIHNYCSLRDIACRLNPFGKSGFIGFANINNRKRCNKPYKNLKIFNYQQFYTNHIGYFKEKYFRKWINILYRGSDSIINERKI